MSKSKGSIFERHICRSLSLWWTKGQDDDCFWRTAGSGGRATTRGKAGKATAGAYGDINSTDERGKALLNFFTFEIKRGYTKATVQDMLDRPDRSAQQTYETWINQAVKSQQLARSKFWAVIFRRDRRKPMILMPRSAWIALRMEYSHEPMNFAEVSVILGGTQHTVVLCPLQTLFANVKPDQIRRR